jgi:hypothetical protein
LHVPHARRQLTPKPLVPLVLGVAVATAIYVFGVNHTPDYSGTALFGRTALDTLPLKSWLATAILVLAIMQLASALWIFRRLPFAPAPPRRLGSAHRLSGATLALLSLPIAYHCMFAYGFQTVDARVAVHSYAGAFLYGALATKVLTVRWHGLPRWMLPLAGGFVVSGVVVLWYTSALWYFKDMKLPHW